MAILNYSTKIAAAKTMGEVQEILSQQGARKIVCDYNDQRIPIAITFSLAVHNEIVSFCLPANYEGVLAAMKKDAAIKNSYCNQEQAIRVAWRIIKDWVEAQCAIIEAGQAEVAEVFLPYAIVKSGNTLFQEIKFRPELLLNR